MGNLFLLLALLILFVTSLMVADVVFDFQNATKASEVNGLQLALHKCIHRGGGVMNIRHLLMDLNRIERVINETVMDEVERGLITDQAPNVIELPIDDLLGDLIIAILDDLRLPKYIIEKDVDGDKITFKIDSKCVSDTYSDLKANWETETEVIKQQYFKDKGVY